MNARSTVLGAASRHEGGRLKVSFVMVSSDGPTLEVLPAWHGTQGAELGQQLTDTYQTIRNRFDPVRPTSVAVKRVESPSFGRPDEHYDARTSFEAVAMLSADQLGCRHFDYRTRELKARFGGQDPLAVAQRVFPACPNDDVTTEATAAALAALIDLGHEIEV